MTLPHMEIINWNSYYKVEAFM